MDNSGSDNFRASFANVWRDKRAKAQNTKNLKNNEPSNYLWGRYANPTAQLSLRGQHQKPNQMVSDKTNKTIERRKQIYTTYKATG